MESGPTRPRQANSEKHCVESVLFMSLEAFMGFPSQILRLFLWRLQRKRVEQSRRVPSLLILRLLRGLVK